MVPLFTCDTLIGVTVLKFQVEAAALGIGFTNNDGNSGPQTNPGSSNADED